MEAKGAFGDCYPSRKKRSRIKLTRREIVIIKERSCACVYSLEFGPVQRLDRNRLPSEMGNSYNYLFDLIITMAFVKCCC